MQSKIMQSKIMQSKIIIVAAGLSIASASFSAQAMPTGSVDGASAVPHITLAAEGCGPGMTMGPAGRCRRPRAVVVAPIVRRPVVVVPIVRGPVVVRRAVRPRCGVRVGPVGVRTPC